MTQTTLAKIRKLKKAVREIDKMAEAGLCQLSLGGAHAFLKDIRLIISEEGITGGLTEYRG